MIAETPVKRLLHASDCHLRTRRLSAGFGGQSDGAIRHGNERSPFDSGNFWITGLQSNMVRDLAGEEVFGGSLNEHLLPSEGSVQSHFGREQDNRIARGSGRQAQREE